MFGYTDSRIDCYYTDYGKGAWSIEIMLGGEKEIKINDYHEVESECSTWQEIRELYRESEISPLVEEIVKDLPKSNILREWLVQAIHGELNPQFYHICF